MLILGWCLITGLSNQSLAQSSTFASGSYIVNMGVTPQTIGNGLKPYGLVYDLVSNYDVPIYWIIKPTKLKDGIDFSYNGTDFKGGPFIIAAENRDATINSRIAYWESQGVVGVTTTSSLTAPVNQKITAVPRWTLDLKSGGIAQSYINNAGISSAFTNWQEPYMLNNCNDIFVMPHADPKWASHSFLYDWNINNRGSIWVSCHAVSVLENMYNPSNLSQQTNFLALNSGGPGSNSLVDFKSHKDGSAPYNNNSYAADPVMQFLGTIDDAVNGSESIYLPALGGGWRSTTKVPVFDPTQIDIPLKSNGKAALIAYGRGYGNANRGWVMYEAGHSHDGGGEANVAAQRAFLNFSLMATLEKSMNISISGIQSVMVSSNVYALSATVTQNIPTGPYTYQWTSSCGGSFSNPAAASTNYTAPVVVNPTNCIIKLKVTDACGRTRLFTQNMQVTSGPRPPVALPDSLVFSPDCINVNPTITIDALANDTEPDGEPMSISVLTGNNGTWTVNPDKTVKYVPTPGFYGLATANYTVCDNTIPTPLCASSTIKVNITSSFLPPAAVADNYDIYEDSVQTFNVLSNDIGGSGTTNISGIPTPPKNGRVSINVNNTITYLPNADYNGLDSFYYTISSNGGYKSTAKVLISIKHDCCTPGNYKRILGPIITTTQNLVANADSYIALKQATTNYGTAQTIITDRETTDKYLGTVNFDLSALICYATLVRSATLKMQMTSGTNQVIEIYRLLNSWNETQVTWNNRFTGIPWAAAGSDYNRDSIVAQTSAPVASIYNWNMDAIMHKMVCNSTTYPNFGFQVRAQCSGEPSSGCGNRQTIFASRENTTAGILKPTLTITFDSAAFICAPIPTRAPLAMPDTISTRSDRNVIINTAVNDYVPAGHAATVSILPSTVYNGSANMVGNTVNFQPSLTFQGITSLQYVITDVITGLTDTAKVFIYVSFPPPLANDDSITILSGAVGSKDFLLNDIDPVGLGFNYAVIGGPNVGSCSHTGSTISYTAPSNFIGRDTITYRLNSMSTGACNETVSSDTAYFIIIVNNRPPVALNDSASANPCQQLVFDVLRNDNDPENGLININSVSTVSPPTAGTAAISGYFIVFTPNPAYIGSSASFTYTIADDAVPPAISSPATITVNLGNIPNLPPVALTDTAYGLSNADTYINVMSNDRDPENDSLYVSLGGGLLQPAHGTVTLLANGLIKYTPAANYSGNDYFDYRLHDYHQGISNGVCTNVSLTKIARVVVGITNLFVILKSELQSFAGVCQAKRNKLTWTVNEVSGNIDYTIERSTDQANYSSIGALKKASAASAGVADYTFYDEAPVSESNFYRIKIAGNGETPFYSGILHLKNQAIQEEAVNLQTYPAPFSEMLTVKFDLPKAEKFKLSLIDANGKLVKTISMTGRKGANTVGLFNLESFSSGIYYIRIDVKEKVLMNKSLKL